MALLGATGSIGRSAAAVISAHPDRFRLFAAAAHRNIAELMRLARESQAEVLALTDKSAAHEAARELRPGVEMLSGEDALCELAVRPEVDIVLCAVLGTAGVRAVIAALRAGKRVALASKEVLVLAGDIVTSIPTGELIPVDSEHSGVFQCLAGRDPAEVALVTLTASGGPFLNWDRGQLAEAKWTDAVKHPVWEMGDKISVDSATMMNKALELIEARHLFRLPPERLEAVIHPQSIVHALVELRDGSTIAQLSNPDMKLPIQYALSFPERLADAPAGRLDLVRSGKLEFLPPDETRFPALRLAREAMLRGGAFPAVLNAANETAVELFREERIGFTHICGLVEAALERRGSGDDGTLESRFAADLETRRFVRELARR